MSGKSVSVRELDAKYHDGDAAKDFAGEHPALLVNAVRDACSEPIAEAAKLEILKQFDALKSELQAEKDWHSFSVSINADAQSAMLKKLRSLQCQRDEYKRNYERKCQDALHWKHKAESRECNHNTDASFD